MNLRGAHAVVTGGSKGIGAATARELSNRGAHLTLIARPSEELHATASATGAAAIEVDLSELDAVEGLIARAEEFNGPVDVLINNAALGATRDFSSLSPETVRKVMLTNLVAPMELSHQVLGGMLRRDRGAILNISSVVGEMPMPHLVCYGTSKAGISHFSLLLQRDILDSNVNISAFVLGAVPGTQIHDEGIKDEVISKVAAKLGRLSNLTPERIATRIARALEADYRGTVALPRSSAPVVHWRRLPNRLGDLVFSRTKSSSGDQVAAAPPDPIPK